jgi:hypothetical protein
VHACTVLPIPCCLFYTRVPHLHAQMSALMGRTDSTIRSMCKTNNWSIISDINPVILARLKNCGAVMRGAKSAGLIKMQDVVQMTRGLASTGESLEWHYKHSKQAPSGLRFSPMMPALSPLHSTLPRAGRDAGRDQQSAEETTAPMTISPTPHFNYPPGFPSLGATALPDVPALDADDDDDDGAPPPWATRANVVRRTDCETNDWE